MNMHTYTLVLCSILRVGGGEGEGNIKVIYVSYLFDLFTSIDISHIAPRLDNNLF